MACAFKYVFCPCPSKFDDGPNEVACVWNGWVVGWYPLYILVVARVLQAARPPSSQMDCIFPGQLTCFTNQPVVNIPPDAGHIPIILLPRGLEEARQRKPYLLLVMVINHVPFFFETFPWLWQKKSPTDPPINGRAVGQQLGWVVSPLFFRQFHFIVIL